MLYIWREICIFPKVYYSIFLKQLFLPPIFLTRVFIFLNRFSPALHKEKKILFFLWSLLSPLPPSTPPPPPPPIPPSPPSNCSLLHKHMSFEKEVLEDNGKQLKTKKKARRMVWVRVLFAIGCSGLHPSLLLVGLGYILPCYWWVWAITSLILEGLGYLLPCYWWVWAITSLLL